MTNFLAKVGVAVCISMPIYAQSAIDLLDQDVANQILQDLTEQSDSTPVNTMGKTVGRDWIQLRFLDRLNGIATDFELQSGELIKERQMEITAKSCFVPADDSASDAIAFLVIKDERDTVPNFQGWMLASSPALSAMDHPRYDVWVVSCSNEPTVEG